MPEGELAVGLARAEIMSNHNDKRGAERILLELADKYPDNPEVLFRLGGVQADLNENEQALNSYQRISHWIAHPRRLCLDGKIAPRDGPRPGSAGSMPSGAGISVATRLWKLMFVCTQIQYSVDNK